MTGRLTILSRPARKVASCKSFRSIAAVSPTLSVRVSERVAVKLRYSRSATEFQSSGLWIEGKSSLVGVAVRPWSRVWLDLAYTHGIEDFDTLSIDRCYRKAHPDAQILEMIRERRGQQFDPRVVDAFFAILDRLVLAREAINAAEEIADVTESDGDWCLIF